MYMDSGTTKVLPAIADLAAEALARQQRLAQIVNAKVSLIERIHDGDSEEVYKTTHRAPRSLYEGPDSTAAAADAYSVGLSAAEDYDVTPTKTSRTTKDTHLFMFSPTVDGSNAHRSSPNAYSRGHAQPPRVAESCGAPLSPDGHHHERRRPQSGEARSVSQPTTHALFASPAAQRWKEAHASQIEGRTSVRLGNTNKYNVDRLYSQGASRSLAGEEEEEREWGNGLPNQTILGGLHMHMDSSPSLDAAAAASDPLSLAVALIAAADDTYGREGYGDEDGDSYSNANKTSRLLHPHLDGRTVAGGRHTRPSLQEDSHLRRRSTSSSNSTRSTTASTRGSSKQQQQLSQHPDLLAARGLVSQALQRLHATDTNALLAQKLSVSKAPSLLVRGGGADRIDNAGERTHAGEVLSTKKETNKEKEGATPVISSSGGNTKGHDGLLLSNSFASGSATGFVRVESAPSTPRLVTEGAGLTTRTPPHPQSSSSYTYTYTYATAAKHSHASSLSPKAQAALAMAIEPVVGGGEGITFSSFDQTALTPTLSGGSLGKKSEQHSGNYGVDRAPDHLSSDKLKAALLDKEQKRLGEYVASAMNEPQRRAVRAFFAGEVLPSTAARVRSSSGLEIVGKSQSSSPQKRSGERSPQKNGRQHATDDGDDLEDFIALAALVRGASTTFQQKDSAHHKGSCHTSSGSNFFSSPILLDARHALFGRPPSETALSSPDAVASSSAFAPSHGSVHPPSTMMMPMLDEAGVALVVNKRLTESARYSNSHLTHLNKSTLSGGSARGMASHALRKEGLGPFAGGFKLDSGDEKDWDDEGDEEDNNHRGAVDVRQEWSTTLPAGHSRFAELLSKVGFTESDTEPPPPPPTSSLSRETSSDQPHGGPTLPMPIPSPVIRTRPPSMAQPYSPYRGGNVAAGNGTYLSSPLPRPTTATQRDNYAVVEDVSNISAIVAAPQTATTTGNTAASFIDGRRVSAQEGFGKTTRAAPPPFFKGLVVPSDRRRIPSFVDKEKAGGLVAPHHNISVASDGSLSRKTSLTGGNTPSKMRGVGLAYAGRFNKRKAGEGGEKDGKEEKGVGNGANSNALTEEARRRQLRDLNDDEQGPRPFTTEEIATEILHVEPFLARLIARQMDAFDRARFEYGPAYVLGGDPIGYSLAMKAPAVTICPKVKQETRSSRLIGGWKLRRMALVGKFLYVFRYPGAELEGGESSPASSRASSLQPSPREKTSSSELSANNRETSGGANDNNKNAEDTVVPSEATESRQRLGSSSPPSSPPSAVQRLLAMPKHKIGGARRDRLIANEGEEAFEKSVLCIDITRALVDIAQKKYKGEERVIYIRINAIQRGGGGGAVFASGGAVGRGGGGGLTRSRSNTSFGGNNNRNRSFSRYNGNHSDRSSARSGDSQEDSLNYSMTSSLSPYGGGGGSGGSQRLHHIRPPTLQTTQVRDLADKEAVEAAIREGAIVTLAFSTQAGLMQWVAAIKNRRETVEAIAQVAEDAQLLSSLQNKKQKAQQKAEEEEEEIASISTSPAANDDAASIGEEGSSTSTSEGLHYEGSSGIVGDVGEKIRSQEGRRGGSDSPLLRSAGRSPKERGSPPELSPTESVQL